MLEYRRIGRSSNMLIFHLYIFLAYDIFPFVNWPLFDFRLAA